MPAHLLAIAVGPVQEFIAAARRTRDLWFGSFLLSEVSKATAKAVRSAGGKLIFPNPNTATDLESESELNVANVILAELPAGIDAREVAGKAKDAAKKRWESFANEAHHEASGVIRPEIWADQVGDVVEFSAAWSPLGDDYRASRARVMRLLAGRKNCRDFLAARGRPGVPKSSLDGLRESVLKDPAVERWPQRFRARLRVREGEQLDVVGLTKRVAGGTQPYPSVSRVAADPWLRGHGGRLGPLIAACQQLGNQVIRRLNTDAGHPHFADFPFEGTAVFRNRHHELVEETELAEGALLPLADAVSKLGGEPNPYLAVIVADGDNMGSTISKLLSPEEHRRFSSKLAQFAVEAGKIVNEHRGVLVYAGGDDVLAFAPVDKCLKCARALHEKFGTLLAELVEELNAKRPPIDHLLSNMTLSVGVAIGHFMENLEDLREYGKAAEKHAKQPDENGVKDALAVHLHKRGGGPIRVRARWTDNPDGRIQEDAHLLLTQAIPSRLPYNLSRMADVYDGWPPTSVAVAIRRDVLRLIAAKAGDRAQLNRVAETVRARVNDAASLREFAAELLIARQIATACRQAGEGRDSR
ncbi:MAG: type III-B CRISPR-associated protein Cas10/Cmr2 [Planctomycetaceae bacterium]|nr:type III-B CRISPR-associated protein Cas10/Cmr2 [Planctomycetaceae bacterium]